ncbi:conserved hypothetical protein [Mariniflexile fucanivorans]
MLNKLRRVYMFGFLKFKKLFSKAAYRKSNRILELTSAYTIAGSQHIYGFVATTQSPIRI